MPKTMGSGQALSMRPEQLDSILSEASPKMRAVNAKTPSGEGRQVRLVSKGMSASNLLSPKRHSRRHQSLGRFAATQNRSRKLKRQLKDIAAARKYGIQLHHITLHELYSYLEDEDKTNREEKESPLEESS